MAIFLLGYTLVEEEMHCDSIAGKYEEGMNKTMFHNLLGKFSHDFRIKTCLKTNKETPKNLD